MAKVMCAMVMVATPRPAGQPVSCSSATNSSSNDRPVITSGITSGAVVMVESMARPRNGPKRTSASPASVPRMTAPVAVIAAICSDSNAASRICPFANSLRYQRRVGELAASQTVTNLELLNEKNTIERMGM